MRFGIFDHVERSGPDVGAVYRDRLRVARAADRGGFFCYHVAEHQGTPLSMAPSPNLVLAQLAGATTRLRLGALCYILPLYDPLRLANEICMLDHMSGGRLEVGIGRGVSPIEMGFYDLDPAGGRSLFEEHLAVLLEALTQQTLDHEGERHRFRRVPLVLSPKQRPYPPIWYPTSGMGSIPWLARRRYRTVFLGSPAHVAAQVARFRECYPDPAALGQAVYGVLRYVFVAETDAEALRVAAPLYARHLDNLAHLARQRGASLRAAVPDTAGAREANPATLADAVREGWAAAGAPETVAEQLAAMRDQTGCNYLVFNPLLADTPGDRAVAQVELFAEQVMAKLT